MNRGPHFEIKFKAATNSAADYNFAIKVDVRLDLSCGRLVH